MDISIILKWFKMHGIDFLQSVGIITGLFYTALSFRHSANMNRLSCKHQIMLSHRDLWDRFADNPNLSRVLDPMPDIASKPISLIERRFVINLIQHVHFVYSVRKYGLIDLKNSSLLDIKKTFSLPIVHVIWNNIKNYQDSDFVSYMDRIIKGVGSER